MDRKASSVMIGIIIVAIIVIVVAIAFYMGYISLSLTGDADDADIDQPIGSDYCDYGTGEIIGMYENLVGKDLNNDIGLTVVNGLSMEACGSNSKLPSEIIGSYMTDFADGWYILLDDTTVKSGFYYRTVVWGNAPLLSNSSLIRSVISGHGVSVETWYNYETLSITGFGSKSGYVACLMWLTS